MRKRQIKKPSYRLGLNYSGITLGIIFFNLSLTPSLLPRSWLLQGILSGISLITGYGIGTILSVVYRNLHGRELSETLKIRAWKILLIGGGLITFIFLLKSDNWQGDARRLMDMPASRPYNVVSLLLTSLLTAFVILGTARLLRLLKRFLSRHLDKFLHRHIANVLGLAFTAVLLIFFLQSIVFHTWLGYMNRVASVADNTTSTGIYQTTSTLKSGGPGSLVNWQDLGKAGRDFIGKAPSPEDLAKFSGLPAKEPVRVYVGLKSADSLQREAELAVRELDRTGAFSRQVLVIATSTGTGWVDPNVARSIEYMYNGDSAIVSMQYSYLPSWIALLSDKETVKVAAKTLNDAVQAKWASLPAEHRPKLLLFGESLGVYGTESAYSNLDDLRGNINGALFVGPPHGSPIWKKLVASRDKGSSEWLPTYNKGQVVRFAVDAQNINHDTEWTNPRVLYLQQSSDPVVWWNGTLIYNKPEWLSGTRGPDISLKMRFVPFVTFWQVTVDLAFASDMPFGHGHNYGAKVVDGWASIAAPENWSKSQTDKLRALIAAEQTL